MDVRSVRVEGGNGQRTYQMDIEDWIDVEENLALLPGMFVIFTRKRFNKLWLTAFSEHGQLTTEAKFKGAMTLVRIQPPLQPYERGQFIYCI